jgi:hypothetical protein
MYRLAMVGCFFVMEWMGMGVVAVAAVAAEEPPPGGR